MRAHLSYAAHREHSAPIPGINPDEPVAGFYRMRLRSGGVYVGVRIWHGLPLDPYTSDEMDRAPCWNAQINGEWASIMDVWPRCAGDPISAQEYAFLQSQRDWAVQHAPDSPVADPTKRVDPLSSPLLF